MNVVVLVVVVILVAVVGVFALIGGAFFLILRANTARSAGVMKDAVERWAEDEGYEIVSSRQADRNSKHPFRDRFGFGLRKRGDFGGVVFRVVVEDRDGEEWSGWLFIPLRGQSGVRLGGTAVAADWQNAEVVWDRD